MPIAVGRTQASSVIAFVRSSELASGTETRSLTPSNVIAPPNLAVAVVRTAPPAIVPVLPRPEASVAVVPVASSKPYAATGAPGAGPVFETVTLTVVAVFVLPAASRATALSVCGPFVAVAVFHATL